MCDHGDTTICIGCAAPIAEGGGQEVGETGMLAHYGCYRTLGLDKIGSSLTNPSEDVRESAAAVLVILSQLRDDETLTGEQRRELRRAGVHASNIAHRLAETESTA